MRAKESLDGVLQRLPPFGFGNSVEINESGLVLGAGSRLARMTWGGLALEDDGERLMALLSIVARRAIAPDALRHIRAASDHWRHGDKALANLRLVFSGLPRVQAKEDAYRLCLAEYLLDQGMAPSALMKELGFDPGVLNFIKYSPDQPRVEKKVEDGRMATGYSLSRSMIPSLVKSTGSDSTNQATMSIRRTSITTIFKSIRSKAPFPLASDLGLSPVMECPLVPDSVQQSLNEIRFRCWDKRLGAILAVPRIRERLQEDFSVTTRNQRPLIATAIHNYIYRIARPAAGRRVVR